MISWNKSKNIDCFGNGNPSNIDHIYPTALGGSNAQTNKMRLSQTSNQAKADNTKGKINGKQFSILRATDKDGNIYGRMQIKKDNGKWEFVDPVL